MTRTPRMPWQVGAVALLTVLGRVHIHDDGSSTSDSYGDAIQHCHAGKRLRSSPAGGRPRVTPHCCGYPGPYWRAVWKPLQLRSLSGRLDNFADARSRPPG